MRCTSANQPAKGPSFAVKPCIRFRLARKPTSAIGVVRNGFLPLGGASAIRCTLAARNRIGGQNFAARQPCNVRPAARAFWRNWPINTVHVGNRSRWGAFRVRMRCTSARPRCIGNIARWATDLGADAVRFASVERRQAARRSRFGCGCVAVRIRSRYGSHRQRAALPRPGLGAFAGSP
jgi:hypothetical protein